MTHYVCVDSHQACLDCISKQKASNMASRHKCPMCRQSLLEPMPIYKPRQMTTLRLCRYATLKHGACNHYVSVDLAEAAIHEDVCPFRTVVCSCGVSSLHHDVDTHALVCTLRTCACPFCNERMLYSTLFQHMADTHNAPVTTTSDLTEHVASMELGYMPNNVNLIVLDSTEKSKSLYAILNVQTDQDTLVFTGKFFRSDVIANDGIMLKIPSRSFTCILNNRTAGCFFQTDFTNHFSVNLNVLRALFGMKTGSPLAGYVTLEIWVNDE